MHRSGVHAKPCTCTPTGCTPTHAHSRAIGAPLRPMPNTVHVHVRCARSTPFTFNRCTVQAAHNRCTTQTAHTEHCASNTHKYFCVTSTPLGSYMTNAIHARIHVLTKIGTPLGCKCRPPYMHTYTHTYKGAPLGLYIPDAIPYAYPRKVRLTSSSINSDRTPRPGNQHTAPQHCSSSTRTCPGPARVLYTRVLHSHAPTNAHVRLYIHYRRNPRAV